ncbi:MAG: matrixin family metalloprotease [Pirellulales bacterium]
MTLRYRFNDLSFQTYFEDPEAAKNEIMLLFGKAVEAWGDACPVTFTLAEENTDFEIVMMQSTSCNNLGCVLASAFFPDRGRHHLRIYPTLLEQERNEQVETLCHEIGHVFGLRHFFANIRETGLPSHLFGSDNELSIMNYGSKSVLTETDKADLKNLYRLAWSGELTEIDGAPIHLIRPFSSTTENLRSSTLAARSVKSTPGKAPSTGTIQLIVGGRTISIE